ERINDDPGTSMKDLAAKMSVDEKTIRTAVHKDLRSKSYILKVRQMLSEASKVKHLVSLKHGAAGRIWFFSDDKIFYVMPNQ
ncbi:Uncharacterized protein FKW44_012727, partial [Caligus rogercresseyi]